MTDRLQLRSLLSQLEQLAQSLAAQLQQGQLDRSRSAACRELLKRVYGVVLDGERAIEADADVEGMSAALLTAISLARELDDALVHDQRLSLYDGRRLGVIRAYDPVRIRPAIDERIVAEVFTRYYYEQSLEQRMESLVLRLETAGYKVPEQQAKLPADYQSYRELIWGRIART